MKKVITGDKSLDNWINFFYYSEKKNTQFIKLIKKTDKYFLTTSPPFSDDIFYPDDGLLEEDFRKVAFANELLEYGDLYEEDIAKKEKTYTDEKTRIVISIIENVNLDIWKAKYENTFHNVIEKSLIEGDYEKYGIEFEKIINFAISKNYISKDNFMEVAILRGVHTGKLYDTEEKIKELKKEIKINKIKIFFGL